MEIKLAGIVDESVVDGPGVRMVFFTQGCPHHCPGCHNPATHGFSGGTSYNTRELTKRILAHPYLSGITLSGGEPLCQAAACAELAVAAKTLGKSVLLYSGYTFEQLPELAAQQPALPKLLKLIDILIDGPFLLAERNIDLVFRGSANQRILDLPRSLTLGRPCELKLGREARGA